ncbi:hypothetical protein JOM56_002705 [Amanita muscaria]
MHLYLTQRSHLNSSFVNDDKHVLYKVKRIAPGSPTHDDLSLQDKFTNLAEIKFNVVDSSVMRFGGQEYEISHFLDKKGLGFYGRKTSTRGFPIRKRTEAKTIDDDDLPQLVRLDRSAKTPIARFHRRRLGILKKKRPASLEIFPEGNHMVKLIIITFVYNFTFKRYVTMERNVLKNA